MHRRLRVTFFATLALAAGASLLANEAEHRRALGEREWAGTGALENGDFTFEETGRLDVWLVTLAEGQRLGVEVRSEAFDPFVRVVGPPSVDGLDGEAVVVAEGAVGEEGGVARVVYSAVAAGEYSVAVLSVVPGATGAYALTSTFPLEDPLDTSIEGGFESLAVVFVVVWPGLLFGLPVFLLWRHPDRILLLRPFGQKDVSRSLKRLCRRRLAYRGYTFTLADRHLKDSLTTFLLAHVPFSLGELAVALYRPLFRRAHRYLLVRTPRDLDLLRTRLRSRWRLGTLWQSWLGGGHRISKVRSRDAYWQACVDLLLDSCQVLVVDVSDAGEGTAWEVEEVFRRGYLYKSVFLVRDDDQEAAAARALVGRVAAKAGGGAGVPVFHRYAEDGALVDGDAFEGAYAEAVASERHPETPPLPISRRAVLALAPSALLGPFWMPVGFVLGLLALRDIRRADGMLRGETAAHVAVLFGLLGLALAAALIVSTR